MSWDWMRKSHHPRSQIVAMFSVDQLRQFLNDVQEMKTLRNNFQTILVNWIQKCLQLLC